MTFSGENIKKTLQENRSIKQARDNVIFERGVFEPTIKMSKINMVILC